MTDFSFNGAASRRRRKGRLSDHRASTGRDGCVCEHRSNPGGSCYGEGVFPCLLVYQKTSKKQALTPEKRASPGVFSPHRRSQQYGATYALLHKHDPALKSCQSRSPRSRPNHLAARSEGAMSSYYSGAAMSAGRLAKTDPTKPSGSMDMSTSTHPRESVSLATLRAK